MKKNVKQYLSILLLIVIFAAIGYYFYHNRDLFKSLYNVKIEQALILILLRLLFFGANGLFLKEFAFVHNIKLRFIEWFGLPVVTTMGNHLTPLSGGMVIRAAYLKYKHQFPYSKFTTLLGATYLTGFWIAGLIGVLITVPLAQKQPEMWYATTVFGLIVFGTSLLFLLPTFQFPWQNRFVGFLNRVLTGWNFIRNDKVLLLKLLVITFVSALINGVSYWLAYKALGFAVPFDKALLVSLITVFSSLLSLTPGNLGVRETLVGLVSAAAGVGGGEGLLAALLVRVASLASAFTLGPLLSMWFTRQIGDQTASDRLLPTSTQPVDR